MANLNGVTNPFFEDDEEESLRAAATPPKGIVNPILDDDDDEEEALLSKKGTTKGKKEGPPPAPAGGLPLLDDEVLPSGVWTPQRKDPEAPRGKKPSELEEFDAAFSFEEDPSGTFSDAFSDLEGDLNPARLTPEEAFKADPENEALPAETLDDLLTGSFASLEGEPAEVFEDTQGLEAFEAHEGDLAEEESPEGVSINSSIDDLLLTFEESFAEESGDSSLDGFFKDDLSDDDYGDDSLLDGFDLETIIGEAIDVGASDIHIVADLPISFTVLGEIVWRRDFKTPNGSVLQRVQQDIISNVLEADFIKELELDTSYVVKKGRHKGRRLRLNIGKNLGTINFTMRVIADQVPSPQELGIAGTLLTWAKLPSGLMMINGPTGTGKSTSIASMIREIQLTRAQKIVTLERPVEFVYPEDGKALVVQREIGRDARTFAKALDSAMRQAPDIIVVGEVRNRVEVNELLRAAESGHLAISTMHTVSPAATINRIMGLYEGDDQRRILSTLGDVTRGFANQVLVKTKDGKGRVAVREILPIDAEVKDLIVKGDVKGIQAVQLREGRTMEQQLVKVVKEGKCTEETARFQAADPLLFDRLMRGR